MFYTAAQKYDFLFISMGTQLSCYVGCDEITCTIQFSRLLGSYFHHSTAVEMRHINHYILPLVQPYAGKT